MNELAKLLRQQVASQLKREALITCSQWSENYRIMGQPFPGPWNFKHHPWLREMHDCVDDFIAGRKAAQMGFTETALNYCFFHIDVHQISVLYVLPATNPDSKDFSTSRFDPALELSEHLSGLFSDVKNIGHKRAGSANLYIRGSRSRSQLKSIPVGLVILDEVDEMVQENIPMTFERMSGQVTKKVFMLSTPTIDDIGIDAYYNQSTMDHYFFNCPLCSRLTELVFPDCLVITSDDFTDPKIKNSHLICRECKGVLQHETKTDWLAKGKWVSGYTDRNYRGFHISQMYSTTVRPYELAISYLKGLSNPSDEQEFYNSKLGEPHVVEGARVIDADINDCIGGFHKYSEAPKNSLVTMGVDVGSFLHYEIDQWYIKPGSGTLDVNLRATCRVLLEGKVKNFEDLHDLMYKFRIRCCVIDANPERRKSLEFAQKFSPYVKMCYYGNNLTTKHINTHLDSPSITVDRTSWLDMSLSRFKTRSINLPVDMSHEYRDHIKNLVRIYEPDCDGHPTGKYVNGSKADHFAHARNYAEIALQVAFSAQSNSTIEGSVL